MKHLTHPYYPLTETAKNLAIFLIELWDEGKIGQFTRVITRPFNKLELNSIYSNEPVYEFDNYTVISSLTELSLYRLVNLVAVSDHKRDYIELLLLQELRNAVANDFKVSDYFLTMNAVGNIIINSTTGNVQGVGYAGGDITQKMTVKQISDELTQLLGQNLIDSHEELRLAIEALRSSNEDEKPSRLKRIATTLTNMLGIGADIATVAPALLFLIALL